MKAKALLSHITLTGVDDHADLSRLTELSGRYPLVEWGFLYSPKRQGQGGRYPSLETLRNAFRKLPEHVRIALHICGSGVPNLLEGEPVVSELAALVADRAGRIQLNFNQTKREIDLDTLSSLLSRFRETYIITQHNKANKGVWKRLCGHANYVILFDSSGGQGIERSDWPAPLGQIHCGYAGGLGPDNVIAELARIWSAARGLPHWIDMEGKLRSGEDTFELKRAEDCLRNATAFTLMSWMSPEEIHAALRFCETCDDSEGYDVPRPMMKRLETLGLVVDKEFGRFEQTELLLDIRDVMDSYHTA